MIKRYAGFLIIAVLLAACSGTTAEEPPSPTNTPRPSATPGPRVTVDFAIEQILLRYSASSAQGNLELLVCNWGPEPSGSFDLKLQVGDIWINWEDERSIPGGQCLTSYQDGADFSLFEITENSLIDVTGEVTPANNLDVTHNNQLTDQLFVEFLATPNNVPGVLYPEDFPLSQDPPDVLKYNNNYWVKAPLSHELVANLAIWENQNCLAAMTSYLGIQEPSWIFQDYPLVDESSLVPGSYLYGAGISFPMTESEFNFLLNETVNDFDLWQRAKNGDCANAHELTHLVLGAPPMPGWLNEGLATYLESPLRLGPDYLSPIECRIDGWFGASFEGPDGFFPYENLIEYDPAIYGIYYYRSAMCFWDFIEESYGQAALQQIVQAVIPYADEKYVGCSDAIYNPLFIRDIVNPIVGEDVSAITLERWGFDATFNGCEDIGF
jgi:hypothetical protein